MSISSCIIWRMFSGLAILFTKTSILDVEAITECPPAWMSLMTVHFPQKMIASMWKIHLEYELNYFIILFRCCESETLSLETIKLTSHERHDILNHRQPGARLTKAYDVTIQRYRNSHAKKHDSKMHILRCMGSNFCVKFQRCPLKFHTKFWTHTPQNMHFTRC